MQATNNSWWVRARMPGALRYHVRSTGRLLAFVLLVELGATLLGFLAPLLFPGTDYTFAGVTVDYALWAVVAAVVCCQVARRRTRFLLQFGGSRFAVWLSNVISLLALLLLFALGTVIVSLLTGLGMGALADAGNSGYRLYGVSAEAGCVAGVWQSLRSGLSNTGAVLWGLSVSVCVLYLFGCCLRRNTLVTLCVVIGVPTVLCTLLLVPALREAADALNSSQGEAMGIAVKWYAVLMDGIAFVNRYFKWIATGAGLISLPLSYLAMRSTKQP